MWDIKRTDELIEWIKELDDEAKEAIYHHLLILQEFGPSLGRPYVDTVHGSKFKNMKELRVQNKKRIFRILFIFDPFRNAFLLIGGDKRNNKKFYIEMISIADSLYANYLKSIEV
jgi:hypothetical protein